MRWTLPLFALLLAAAPLSDEGKLVRRIQLCHEAGDAALAKQEIDLYFTNYSGGEGLSVVHQIAAQIASLEDRDLDAVAHYQSITDPAIERQAFRDYLRLLYKLGQFEKIQELAEQWEGDSQLHFYLGKIASDPAEAAGHLRRSDLKEAKLLLAKICEQQGNFLEAAHVCAQLGAKRGAALNQLRHTASGAREPFDYDAICAAEQLLLDRVPSEQLRALVAQALIEIGHLEEAESRLQGGSLEMHLLLAQRWMECEQWQRAHQLLATLPPSKEVWIARYNCHTQLGDHAGAAGDLYELWRVGYPLQRSDLLWLVDIKGGVDLLEALLFEEEELRLYCSGRFLEEEALLLAESREEIYETLAAKIESHSNWPWKRAFEVASALLERELFAKAMRLYERLEGPAAQLGSLRCQLAEGREEELLEALDQLGTHRSAEGEPAHIEAAVLAARLRAKLGKGDLRELLRQVTCDFQDESSVWRRRYQDSLRHWPEKRRIVLEIVRQIEEESRL